ncbi:MAG TPA: hypothetical protein VFW23_08425 [Tepidisphaeraceae bacterium]|nr:hypothetical protein [Tepidisphaeraceae bacterium]
MRPAFSPRAVGILRDFLEPNGELLPLKTSSGPFFAFNLTTVADVLNFRRSQIRWLERPIIAGNIERYEFFASRLKGLSIFRLPEDAVRVYVTTPFVERVKKHNLRGIEFPKVWPLPRGVSWKHLAKALRWERTSRGLPPGQTINGESVFITLTLKNPDAFATNAQEERILRMQAELRALLVDENSDAPGVGNPEFGDCTHPGKCKIVLSCPSANALIEAIRPWLKKLKWPHEVTVVKRFGPHYEPKVRTARVKF